MLPTIVLLAVAALLPGAAATASSGGESFAPQGPKLLAEGEAGLARLGRGVALSADGDTAIVGGPRDSGEAGAAWVFIRTSGEWSQQAKLQAPEGTNFFGRSVAMSADGSTVVVGDPGSGKRTGTAWIFARSGDAWRQQARLTGAGERGAGQFGRSVAMAADGATALIGAFNDNGGKGAAYTFERTGDAWAQSAKIAGAEEVGPSLFGRSVALSGDGETAAIGGTGDDESVGAAWIFTKQEAGRWTQQGPKLTASDEAGAGEVGSATALSADGSTALIGGSDDDARTGAAWVFTRGDGRWTQRGSKLRAGDEAGEAQFGYTLSLSADASTALV
ncbi:MAG TPA: hypothetical protein VH025_05905, partial [Solirubrobacteraceae bacterium]|nr:hypothetical protein [Solirubrobacteraceae bacterium]